MSKQSKHGHELTNEQIIDFGLEEAPTEAGRSIEEIIVINLYGENITNEQRHSNNKEERN